MSADTIDLTPYAATIARLTPQVKAPSAKVRPGARAAAANPPQVTPQAKFLWTALALIIFMVASQIPLYGISAENYANPWYWSQMVIASNRHSLMELGISPILTSGLIVQVLTGLQMVSFDAHDPNARVLSGAIQRISGVLMTLFQAVFYVSIGTFGPPRALGFNAVLIVLQILVAGVMVIFLDELLQSGYGFGSAINIFVVANICETIVWRAFSPVFVRTASGGLQFEGAVLAAAYLLLTRRNKAVALREAFYRQNMTNLWNVLATAIVFTAAIYIQGVRVNLALADKRRQHVHQVYPIKLLYTSNMPIIIQSTILSNIYFISQILYRKFPNILVGLLGVWVEHPEHPRHIVPVRGLVAYLVPPTSVLDVFTNPLHFAFYVGFILSTCALLSCLWLQMSGSGPDALAAQLERQGLVVPGHRNDSTQRTLRRIIPHIAVLGGLCIGALAIVSDLLGAIGSGTGILLCVTTILSLYESISKEISDGGKSVLSTGWWTS